MISALDSSVILDVVTNDRQFAEASEQALRKASAEGRLIICDCVLAEIFPAFGKSSTVESFLSDWQIDFVPMTIESALLAGKQFTSHLARGGKEGRIVADFLIGSHAQLQADRLVARDRGYLRDYFAKLDLLDPSRED